MLHYFHLDVFTPQLFGGNQLAVFLDPPLDLSLALMQALAREMAYSESTFVFPPDQEGTDMRVRIFTPAEELPMAGHPTIGTAFALAHAGRLRPGQSGTVFGEGVGPVPITLEWHNDHLTFAWMTQGEPQLGPTLDDVSGMASALGLDAADLSPGGLPIQRVSCGTPYTLVPMRSRDAIDRAALAEQPLGHLYTRAGWPMLPVYLFTLEAGTDDAGAYTRMFAPMFGITEDAATGSAAGPLVGYLVHHGAWPAGALRLITLQGVRMGRPSWIHTVPVFTGELLTAVRVGGEAVMVGEGSIWVEGSAPTTAAPPPSRAQA
jgi:trans-2,3-dihydro-3-hydroxyanthranilate isomerase